MAKSSRIRSVKALKLLPSEVKLLDFRVVSLICERFLRPEQATKGRFRTSATSSIGIGESPDGEKSRIMIECEFELAGNTLPTKAEDAGKGDVPGAKTFLIKIKTEALFSVIEGRKVSFENTSAELASHLYSQVHPLVMSRLRTLALEMGFRGVRPDLGFNPVKATIKKALVAA